jgi:hypothetical protein
MYKKGIISNSRILRRNIKLLFKKKIMNSTHNSTFLTKCPFCAKESTCPESLRNQHVFCSYCYRDFILIEYQNNTQIQSTERDMKIREAVNQIAVTLETQLKEMKSNLQAKQQTPLLQDATNRCTQKLELGDQENSHIKELEEKIAKLQQNEKISQHKYNDLEDMYYKEVMEKDQEIFV